MSKPTTSPGSSLSGIAPMKGIAALEEIQREHLDRILFAALQAIYKFQQSKMASYGLDYEDIYLLQFLRNESPARMGDIAGEMRIPISTATRVVDRLEAKRLLRREKDPRDRRNILVSLENKGEAAVRQIEEHTYAILTKNLEGFTVEDIAAFFKTAYHLPEILRVGA
ncbi:MAG: MarR family transcriptional regulator [Spirochaetes bacterium]|nr:MarR family transcriptional regulator [Spirochaetota bacterium]